MTRICLEPREVRALERDGFGWGHDLDCGCLRIDGERPARAPLVARLRALFVRRGRP